MKVVPFFSIIIPTYNRANFILKTINSVLAQDFKEFEIIVIDDGSTDGTEAVVTSIRNDQVRYYKKVNEERAAARNLGTQFAQGEYVNFLDSDDLLYPNHLSEAYNLINTYNNPELFHLGYDIKDLQGNVQERVNYLKGDLNERLIFGNILATSGVFIRKDIALKFPFNPDRNLAVAEDFELWLRLAARFPLRYTNTITSSLINHNDRSVLDIEKEKLIKHQQLFIKYIWEDDLVLKKYGQHQRFMLAQAYTYISLHLAITKKHKKSAFQYLLKSLIIYPNILGTRRFWASLKRII